MLRREECRLRPLDESDLDTVLRWRNSDRIRANMYSDHLITPDEHRNWYENVRQEKGIICRIFEWMGRPLGVVNITQIDKHSKKCHWGFYIGESDAPKGSGSAMGYLALEYIFDDLEFFKLCAEVFSFNVSSIQYHKKLGFVEEGRFVKHVLKNGKYEDIIRMAAFNSDWKIRKKELNKLCFESGGNS